MRLARIRAGSVVDFAIGGPSTGWVPLSRLGVTARTVGEAILGLKTVRPNAIEQADTVTEVELLCPALGAGKIFGIGMNYADHAEQSGVAVPERPLVFSKLPSALIGPFDTVRFPDIPLEVELECEIAVIIGAEGRDIPVSRAAAHVFGFAVANDLSARNLQRADQVTLGKGLDTFCPLGPWITTLDVSVVGAGVEVCSWVNDHPVQRGVSSQMVRGVEELVSFVSAGITLHPGDVILSGTPGRASDARASGSRVLVGDVVRCEIEGLGAIENPVEAARGLAS